MAVEKGSWWLGAIYLGDTLIAGWWGGGGELNMKWGLWVGTLWTWIYWACPCKYTIWDYTFFPVCSRNNSLWILAYNNVDNYFVGGWRNWAETLCAFCVALYCDKYPGRYYANRSTTYWMYYNTDNGCWEQKWTNAPADCRAEVLMWNVSGVVYHCDFGVCYYFSCWHWQFVYII